MTTDRVSSEQTYFTLHGYTAFQMLNETVVRIEDRMTDKENPSHILLLKSMGVESRGGPPGQTYLKNSSLCFGFIPEKIV